MHLLQIIALLIFSSKFIYGAIRKQTKKLVPIYSLIIQIIVFLIVYRIDNLFWFSDNLVLLSLGLGIFLTGYMLSIIAVREKKKSLTTTGPYKYIRHPMHVGTVLEYLGLLILFFNWTTLIIYTVMTIFTSYGIKKEEQEIEKKFSKYKTYKKQTGMFFPKF